MKFRSFIYFLREAARSMVRNRLMSVASVLTVASCIFIVSVFYIVAANLDFFLNQIESSIHVVVYIHEDISADGVAELYETVLALPNVTSVKYKSAADGYEEYLSLLENKQMAAGLDESSAFRRSFDIEIDDLRNQDGVVLALEELQSAGIDNIRNSPELARITKTISDGIRAVCIVLIFILGVISIVIIINTIRITVNARKNEINIMKYVGATNWFIRWPFIIEGILIGLFGGTLPALVCRLTYGRVVDMIQAGLPVIDFIEFRQGHEMFIYLIPFDLLLGVVIGMTGSVFSVRKHLKV